MRVLTILTLAAAGSVASAFLQEPSKTPPTGSSQGSTSGSSSTLTNTPESRIDGFLAGWLLAGAENAIQIGEFAQERAQDPEVKRFAQQSVEEHRKLVEKLRPFAASYDSKYGHGTGTDGEKFRGGTDGSSGSSQTGRAGDTTGKMGEMYGDSTKSMIIQELGQQCLDSTKKELQQHSGADFDRCYMGMMVGEHMKANDMLIVFQRHASGQLRSVLSDAQSSVSTNFDKAKDLFRKFDRAG